jgi:GNAT superfamily N-acetyltransferase
MVPMPEIVIRLAVRDLEPGDLPSCTWSGTATHLAAMARALERTRQSCGIGALLIQAAEQRIRAHGLRRAELSVEDSNPRARALYERARLRRLRQRA